jgi:3-isopropylmalate/(R)-2-methylmalate dehydratase large subunit
VLHLLALPAIRGGAGVGKVFEFRGPVVRALATDERATLTNMTAELGGFTGIVAPDEETVRFLRERRGVAFALEPWMRSDAGARYADVIRVDCSALTPMVARPGDPGNGVPLSEIGERVRFDIAYGGSCTAGKREDFDHYHEVLSWAAERGLRVAPGRRALPAIRNDRRSATTASAAATSTRSSASARACCSPRAAPARTAGRGRRPRAGR